MCTFEQLAAERLAEIDVLYPTAHKRQITARLRRAWEKQPAVERIPYVVLHYRQDGFSPRDDLSAWENEFLAQLQGILHHREWDDDYLPVFHFGIIQALIPACFGCGERRSQDGRSVETVPVIHEAADVYKLASVGFGPDTLGGRMLEKMCFFQRAAQGRILLAETDMQGPFSVASQIWGVEEFLLAIYEEPEAVHHLLELTTDAIISYIQRMFVVTEGNLSPLPLHAVSVDGQPIRRMCQRGFARGGIPGGGQGIYCPISRAHRPGIWRYADAYLRQYEPQHPGARQYPVSDRGELLLE